MGFSRRERLAMANMRNEEQESVPAGGSILDDIITMSEENNPEPVKAVEADPEEKDTPPAPPEREEGNISKEEREEKESGDVSERLRERAGKEKKVARISVALYPSLAAGIREKAKEIGCSVNDLVNEVLLDWYNKN